MCYWMLSAVLCCIQGKREGRTGEDSEGTNDQASSPLHVLSDAAHKEGDFAQQPAKRLAREEARGTPLTRLHSAVLL